MDEIGNLQNLIEHLKEIFIGEKSELCAKINSLENTIEKDDVLREEACKRVSQIEENFLATLSSTSQVWTILVSFYILILFSHETQLKRNLKK